MNDINRGRLGTRDACRAHNSGVTIVKLAVTNHGCAFIFTISQQSIDGGGDIPKPLGTVRINVLLNPTSNMCNSLLLRASLGWVVHTNKRWLRLGKRIASHS